jgi:periplasmic divalent cation tolerance protein
MTGKIVVLSTCGSEEEAVRIAKKLIEGHIAACVNLVPRIRSFYRWQGKLEDSAEWLLVIKTSRARFAALRTVLEAAHSYELPEVLALPIVDGSPNYLAWLDTELDGEHAADPETENG